MATKNLRPRVWPRYVALRGAMYFTLKVTEPDLLIYPSWIVILDNVLPPLFTLWMCFVFTPSENDRFFPLWFSGPCSFVLRLFVFYRHVILFAINASFGAWHTVCVTHRPVQTRTLRLTFSSSPFVFYRHVILFAINASFGAWHTVCVTHRPVQTRTLRLTSATWGARDARTIGVPRGRTHSHYFIW